MDLNPPEILQKTNNLAILPGLDAISTKLGLLHFGTLFLVCVALPLRPPAAVLLQPGENRKAMRIALFCKTEFSAACELIWPMKELTFHAALSEVRHDVAIWAAHPAAP